MIAVQIALGLFGLGIVVFVHELGHFLVARAVGIDVEAFSIGWGRPILKKKVRGVEYRLGMFPLGGYCKMRGHGEITGPETAAGAQPDRGSFYGASPLRRIAVCLGGPVFNLIFAVVVLSVIWGTGVQFSTQENRIVLASQLSPETDFPAAAAGLKTGDRIIAINGVPTDFAHQIRENTTLNPGRMLSLTVDRQGEILNLYATPELDRSTGAGFLGIHFWTDAVVAEVVPDSDAAVAGLAAGDRIVRLNGREVANTVDVMEVLAYSVDPMDVLANRPAHVSIDLVRDGEEVRVELLTQLGGAGMGIIWPTVLYSTPPLSPAAAVARGARETWQTLSISVRSLSLLFSGINLTQAVSGPLRITYMVGDVAAAGFRQNAVTGIRAMADFLALISIILCVMNLLPIPMLDGGQIVLFTVEAVRRKPAPPKALRAFQTVGWALILSLMVFALFGDIVFLGGRIAGG